MLFLLFQLGADRYALEAARVAEILPLVQVRPLPQAPPGLSGVINYRGRPVPVIDLCELALDRAAHSRMSTRIVLVECEAGLGAGSLIGLIAESVTATFRRERSDFVESGIANPATPYLGPVTVLHKGQEMSAGAAARGSGAGELVQWIDPLALLTPAVRAVLRQTVAGG
jgi:chemotaxis-related protein WspB